MLRELIVENLGVIQRAELELGPGSSALTGETGAGKTLLVSALALVMGRRADPSLIRSGATEARVEALFHLDEEHPAIGALRERGLISDDENEVLITRTISQGGGKVRINGRLSGVGALAEVGGSLVEIAGQHDHHRLGSRPHQRALLDAYAGPDATSLGDDVALAVRRAADARARADELERGERERERELDVLRYEIKEIAGVAPRPGESEELRAEADRLEHAEEIAAAVESARSNLDDEGGASDRLRAALDALGPVSGKDPGLGLAAARLQDLVVELEDVTAEIATARPSMDPGDLDALRDRLAALARLQRKYGDDDAGVIGYLERAEARMAELEEATLDIDKSRAEAAEQLVTATALAERLSALRAAAGARLAREVTETLGSLAMQGTELEVALVPAELHEGGLETVELRITSPGHTPGPLSKVASGGELSRIALALRLAAGPYADPASTMIFDEVDAGVGGEAARAVGKRLADLARAAGIQVLVVTHLPQVAAFADRHHRVRKDVIEGRTTATVDGLEGPARVEELSRMLAGLPDSERAREHAQELLEMAAGS